MNYLILTEIILGYYFLKNSFTDILGNAYITLLLFVLYLIGKIIYYIGFNKIISRVAIIASIIVLATDCFAGNGLMILFFPITMCQLTSCLLGNKMIPNILLAVPLFFLSKDIIDIYIIVAGLSFVLEISNRQYNEKISMQNEKIYEYKINQTNLINKLKVSQQTMENSIYQVKLEERSDISQKLHDEIGHNLAGNIMRLEAIKKIMEMDTDKAYQMLETVIENLRFGMHRIREILKRVKPERSSMNISNIKDIVHGMNEESPCIINLNYTSDINIISQNMWNAIISNIRESLTNMIKYADASECTIDFVKLNKLYKVTIKDNGVGCQNISKRLGLRGIEDRMAAADGYAIFDGSDGFSTTLIFNINENT